MTHEAALDAALTAFWKHPPPLHEDDTAEIAAAIQAYLSASGMVLVPREPTEQMMKSEFDKVVYKSYLAGAPDPFKSKP